MNPPAEYGQIVRELRAIGSNVHQLLLKAIQIKFIDEVMVCDLYNRAGYGRKVHLHFFIQTLQKEDERDVERR